MYKKSVIGLVFVLILLLALGSIASADPPGNGSGWVSGFFVTNKATTDATVQMNFYKENNGTAAYSPSRTVKAGDTSFFYLGSGGDLNGDITDNGEYSVVLSSDEDILAVVNSTSSGTGQSTTSFDGVGDPAAKLFAPNIYSDYYGFITNFYLQNAGSSDTTVNIKYFDASGSEIASLAETVSIPAGSFIKRDQTGKTALAKNTVCSATFECTGTDCKLAGVVNIVNSKTSIGTANYVMYGAGSTTAYAPVVLNNYYNFNSSINVQNNGTGAVDVQITFSDGTTVKASDAVSDGGNGGTLGEGQAWSVYLPNLSGLASGNTDGALAAKVEVLSPTAGNSIVVLGNTSSSADASFASYNGVTSGAKTVYAPAANALAYNVANGYFTSITCQNLGSGSTDLTYEWSGQDTKSGYASVSGSGKMSSISGAPTTLASGESFVLLPNVASHRTGLGNMPAGFNGAIKVVATEDISCVINQNLSGGSADQDNLGSYTGRP